MAYSLVHHSFMTDSVATLLHAIIRYYNAKKDNNKVVVPEVENSNEELFSYPWNYCSMTLLEHLLEDRQILSEFYRRQYTTLSNVIVEGDCDLFYLLVKYDLLNVKALEDYPVIKYSEQEQKDDAMVIWNYCREFRCGQGRNSVRIYEPYCQYKYLKKLEKFPSISERRLRIALWGLDSIIRSDYLRVPTDRKVLCLKILYEFISEPFITSAEIDGIVQYIGGGNSSETAVKRFREVFEEYFPESKEGYRPRSLAHLCCCQVRQNLRTAGKFPDGVEKLLLPVSVRSQIVPEQPFVVSREIMQLKFEDMFPPQPFQLPTDEMAELIIRDRRLYRSEWWQEW